MLKDLHDMQENDLLYDEGDEKMAMQRTSRLSHKILMKSTFFNVSLSFCTFWSIFADDLKKWKFDQTWDHFFDVLIVVAIVWWVMEMYCKIDLGRKAYVSGFPFFLDVMSGLSLVFDISFFAEGFLNSSTADKAKFSRAGRAARLGTNVARVVKLGKLCRLGGLKR